MVKIPENVKQVLKTLNDNGYEGYIVGGAVRDYVMGKEPNDWDITTNANPSEVKGLFSHTIDTGLKHGTVTAMLDGEGYEITTYRTEGKYSDGRHPDSVEFVTDLKEDLARRDFTINAIAMDVDGNLVDPFSGVEDIKNKTIRCVGNPDDRFSEDALRMLRAVRFEAKLGFSMTEETAESIKRNASKLDKISAERIREEFTKILLSENPTKGFDDAYRCGITKVVLPEFDAMMECEQNSPYHYTDVAHHSLDVVKGVEPKPTLRWAALLHDSGKPAVKTWSEEKQRDRFIGHADESVRISKDIMTRLRFSNADADRILKLVEHHDFDSETPSKLRRFAGKYGKDFISDLEKLSKADGMAHSDAFRQELMNKKIAMFNKMNSYFEDGTAIDIHGLKVNGNELMELGLKGKMIGKFMEVAHNDCLGQPSHNTNEFLRAQAVKFKEKEERIAANRARTAGKFFGDIQSGSDGTTYQP